MQLIGVLVFFAATVGMWIWVVRNRGTGNLWLANLAGAVGSFIVGLAVLILFNRWFVPGGNSARGVVFMFYTLMAVLGAFVGTWLLVIAWLKQSEYPVVRHVIAGACSVLAALTTVVLWVMILPAK
ncbi:hypothetical protein [Pseudomonas frederiksbergensis]|uniref:Uncharacterized protein n=1 Tax=Pseudomonas frederiksbergensis TaxID=104087 RepID=A0A423HIK4_9PSED|nr:hypothetical protein [Pseudomonas frederiksbergensis]RON13058.1 hypothetical protein BK662_29150 [Pseudomonas frederiksbergensis]